MPKFIFSHPKIILVTLSHWSFRSDRVFRSQPTFTCPELTQALPRSTGGGIGRPVCKPSSSLSLSLLLSPSLPLSPSSPPSPPPPLSPSLPHSISLPLFLSLSASLPLLSRSPQPTCTCPEFRLQAAFKRRGNTLKSCKDLRWKDKVKIWP